MRATVVAQMVLVAAVFAAQAGGRNVAVDAVTRATTYHSYDGEVAALTDGLVPGGAETAPAFRWNTQGILVFEWSETLPVSRVRVYVGGIGNDYVIRTFVGGRLNSAGTLREPEGLETASVEEHSRVADTWIDTDLPEGTLADNIEILALGPIVLYEVEIQVRDSETAVLNLTWGDLKGR